MLTTQRVMYFTSIKFKVIKSKIIFLFLFAFAFPAVAQMQQENRYEILLDLQPVQAYKVLPASEGVVGAADCGK